LLHFGGSQNGKLGCIDPAYLHLVDHNPAPPLYLVFLIIAARISVYTRAAVRGAALTPSAAKGKQVQKKTPSIESAGRCRTNRQQAQA
jgi:hypothetical protein